MTVKVKQVGGGDKYSGFVQLSQRAMNGRLYFVWQRVKFGVGGVSVVDDL